jgi:glycosyltransferase involved in cell wall biosynthesis
MNSAKGQTAIIYAPRYPYPPTSGGVKRTLRLVEAVGRAGAQAVVVSPDAAGVECDAERKEREWRARAVSTRESALVLRARQHVRLFGSYPRDIARELRRLASSAAFMQFEGHLSAAYVPAVASAPAVLSMHNVDSAIERAKAEESGGLSVMRLRSAYRAQRIRRLEQVAGRRAEAVMCVSEDDAAAFEPVARRVIVVPNGVDDEFFASPAELPSNEDIVFFGQFSYEPNLRGVRRFLAEGWPALAAQRPRARLLLAGEGGPAAFPRARLPERVQALGVVPDLPALLARCRLVVVPIWQGGGTRLKVLEALASGRPLVGTRLGVSGIGFRPGEHGLVEDTPARLAVAAEHLLNDAELSMRLACAGGQLAERYAWARTLAPAEALYRELIERRASVMRAGT